MAVELVTLLDELMEVRTEILGVPVSCFNIVSSWHRFRQTNTHDHMRWFEASDTTVTHWPIGYDELEREFNEFGKYSNYIVAQLYGTDGTVTIAKLMDQRKIVIEMYPASDVNTGATVVSLFARER